ncbi:sirohydrochlorin chelatase [Nostoc sp. UHCC 0302]|uniref:sirohydrochlorin chelatase n=1 Tax=Nostoc sp. UHCC 0302 TaxID=3134896 RepID=UPI00311CD664
MPSAYLLVSHGSRDPRPEIAMQQLAELLRCILQSEFDKNPNQAAIADKVVSRLSYEKLVGVAYLEMSSEPLHEQIKQFAKSVGCECNCVKIIPLFLLPGVHAMTDIPAEVVLAQQALGQNMIIELQPYLGSHPNLEKLLAKSLATIKAEARILLAHGSRRLKSQEPVEAMAKSLGAVAAYWAGPPSLELRVKEFVGAGYREIAILPYFLFVGGITDAIAQSIEELKLQFPAVTFQLAQPLGASRELAQLIWDLCR